LTILTFDLHLTIRSKNNEKISYIVFAVKLDKNKSAFLYVRCREKKMKLSFVLTIVCSVVFLSTIPGWADSFAEIKNEAPTLIVPFSSVKPGDKIRLIFRKTPGNLQDWIAFAPVDAPEQLYGEWYYLEGKIEGELFFTAPENEGEYEFRLFADWPTGGYEILTQSNKVKIVAEKDISVSTSPPASGPDTELFTVILDDNFNSENNGQGTLNYSSFINWEVTEGSVDLIGNGLYDFFPENGLYLDLDGNIRKAGTLKSKNIFKLEPGTYELEFDLAGNPYGGPNTVNVSLNKLYNKDFTLNKNEPFKNISCQISVPNVTDCHLVFKHTGGDNVGIILDNVRLKKLSSATIEETVEKEEPSPNRKIFSLEGKWYGEWDRIGSNHEAFLEGSGNGYYYIGTNGNYRHEGMLYGDGSIFSGELTDTPGWCCGNIGNIWLEVIDENTVRVRSEWQKPESEIIHISLPWKTWNRVDEKKVLPGKSTEQDFSSLALWQDTWHDTQGNTYLYRIPVNIFTQIEISNYQFGIILELDNFNYNRAQFEGEDIRAVIENKGKLFELSYWIEEWNPEGTSKLWVKLPQMKETTKIYLYYGNFEVNSKSNEKDVFEFFDDFSDLKEWSVYGNEPVLTNLRGKSVIEMKGWSEIAHPLKLSDSNYAFESRSTLIFGMEAYSPFFGFNGSDRRGDEDNAYQFGYNVWAGKYLDNIRVFKDKSQKIIVNGDPAYAKRSSWTHTKFMSYKGTLRQIVQEAATGEQKITTQETIWKNNTPQEVGIIVSSGARYAIDWLFVRKYLEPEPTFSLGDEEENFFLEEQIKKTEPVLEEDSEITITDIIFYIRNCQENLLKQSEIIKRLEQEIETLKARIDQLEKQKNN